VELGERVRIHPCEQPSGDLRDEQSSHDTTPGKERRLGQALRHHPAWRSAKRTPNRRLSRARDVAREQEIQHVRACNSEHDCDGRPEQEQSGPGLAELAVAQFHC